MIEKALRQYLLDQPEIAAIVGKAIYIGRRTDDSGFIAITIQHTGADAEYDLAGESGSFSPSVPLTFWSRGPVTDTRDQLYEYTRLKVSGFRGNWGQVFVQGCTLESGSGRDLPPLPPRDGDKLWWYSKTMNLRITFRQQRTTYAN